MKFILSLLLSFTLIQTADAAKPKKQKAQKETAVETVQTAPSEPGLLGIQPPAVDCKQAYLVDLNTHTVLWAKDANIPVPPSSMTKIMSIYVIFDHLKKGRLKMDQMVEISPKAWKTEGSRMFVDVGTQVSVKDLIYGIIVQSGNDAAVAMAEAVGGTETAFAEMMTAKARELGATHSTFLNATGLPDPSHMATLSDLSLIAERTITDFPDLYAIYGEKEFTYNNITQPNRNPLLANYGGCDGLKTGFTDAGGYGLVASASQNGRRLILVINGSSSMKTRAQDAQTLMTWGFKSYASPVLIRKGQKLEEAPLWLGSQGTIPLEAGETVAMTVPRTQLYDIKVNLSYDTPVAAPVQKGQKVGTITVTIPGQQPRSYPLVAGADAGKANVFSRMGSAFNYLVFGNSS